jgi:hypothetical protein
MKPWLWRAGGAALALGLAGHAPVAAAQDWSWRATLYGWFPSIHSESQSFDAGGGQHIAVEADPGGYLSHLQSAFMGSVEARRGRWSLVGDAIYLNLGDTKSRATSISGPGGRLAVPLSTRIETDLEGLVVTVAAGYRIGGIAAEGADAVFGIRHARVSPALAWDFGTPVGALARSGAADFTESFTDAIAGLRGRAPLAGHWFVPYHVDLGTGSSRFTWQALAGVGYRFGWGEASVIYRHLAYEFKSDAPISNLTFSGPALGASFSF